MAVGCSTQVVRAPADSEQPLVFETGRSLFAAAGGDHACEGVVELLLRCKVLEREVHTIAPVVAWVCRNVDTLIVRILATERTVH